jgi:hypothetical protein
VSLNELHALGFDLSTKEVQREAGRFQVDVLHVRCSQCAAVCVNGTPTHEQRCPNAVYECRGCDELIPMRQRYCSECLATIASSVD